jgi:sigma-B regulation protein RsbU (phosphoserine phosphatase)
VTAERLGGKIPEQVVGKTDFDFLPEERARLYFETEQRIMQTGEPLINHLQKRVLPDGDVIWTSATKVPMRDAAGTIIGLVGINLDITEHKQEAEELRRSRDEMEWLVAARTAELTRERLLLRKLIDHLPDAVYVKDIQGRKVLANQADLKNIRCKTEAEVVGKTDFDLFPREEAEKFWADDQQVLQGQPVIDREEYLLDAAGQKQWLLTTKLPLQDAQGRITGLVGIGRNITRRKQAEESLDRERRLLRTLIDNLPDGIYAKDAEGRKTLANPANLKNIHCSSEAEVLGKNDFDFFSREEAERFWADDQQVLRGEPVIDREESFIDKSGVKRWTLTTKLPLRDAAGRITGLVGIGRNITRRKQAEESLDRERRLLRTLIDNLPDCIYAKDLEGRKTLANPADLKNLRCKTEAEAIGKNDFDLFPREVAEKFWADDQKVLRGEPVFNREEYFFDEAGEKRWLLTSKLPLPDQNGAVVGLIGIARDITVIKKAEEKLAEHMRELEQRDHQTREELNMARELQLAMLPQVFPSVPRHKPAAESHLEFFSFYCPSGAVSGDFFDVVPLSDSAVGLFICDAMGHDVRAALVTAMMRALVADLSATVKDPGELLTQMNRELSGIFKQSGSIMYATAFYLIVDLAREEFRFASAAHPDPILLHRGSNTVEWLKVDAGGKKGPALGLFADGRFPTYRRPMAAGDLIALFTDGLVEVEGAGEEMYTAERLLAAVRQRVQLPSNELFTGVIEEIKQFAATPSFTDDICLASVEVKRLEVKA